MTYTTLDALPPTRRVELIKKKDYTKVALDNNVGLFSVHKSINGLS